MVEASFHSFFHHLKESKCKMNFSDCFPVLWIKPAASLTAFQVVCFRALTRKPSLCFCALQLLLSMYQASLQLLRGWNTLGQPALPLATHGFWGASVTGSQEPQEQARDPDPFGQQVVQLTWPGGAPAWLGWWVWKIRLHGTFACTCGAESRGMKRTWGYSGLVLAAPRGRGWRDHVGYVCAGERPAWGGGEEEDPQGPGALDLGGMERHGWVRNSSRMCKEK